MSVAKIPRLDCALVRIFFMYVNLFWYWANGRRVSKEFQSFDSMRRKVVG